jgi:hypothetical protein
VSGFLIGSALNFIFDHRAPSTESEEHKQHMMRLYKLSIKPRPNKTIVAQNKVSIAALPNLPFDPPTHILFPLNRN